MIEFLNNFHFLRPWCLLFLFIPLALYLKKISIKNSVSSWEDICDKPLFDFLSVNNKNVKKKNLKKYIYTALLFSSFAAAGPCWKKTEIPSFVIENPNLFVLSMSNDMFNTDIKPSRMDRAKYMVSDIVDEVEQGQFGLEVYSDEPFVISPITDDANLIKNLTQQVSLDIMPSYGDRLDRAIDLAIKKFQDANYSSGNIILFTSDVGQKFDLALKHAEKAKKSKYTINIIDASFDGNEKLRLLTEKGNGVYLRIRENNIKPLIKKLNDINAEKTKLSQNMRSNYEDFGYYLLIVPLISVLMFFRKGFLVFLLLFSFNAEASFWKNNDQEGYALFKQEKFDEAYKKFEDPLWKSVALYRQEKFEESLKELEKENSEIALYNKGVVLTKLCKYEEAKNVFLEVSKINPNNEDAIHNLRELENLFIKAKKDPSVLECDNQKQCDNPNQSEDNNNKNEENKNEKSEQPSDLQGDNKEKDSKSKDGQNNQENQQENNEQKNSNEQQEKQQSGSQDEENKNNNQQDENQEQNSKESNNEKQNNENEPPKGDSDKDTNENQNNNNTNDEANGDKTEGKRKDNNKNNDTSSNDEESTQEAQQDVSVMNAKKGNDDEEYDEEALIMQRRYREIPDDVGGLLREFIQKEYIKDRYRNEVN
ncbi:MAG: VWA domain-containing protein [Alphaproteobacteria bacterium]|nr:VWA domain-containing protein [Alphaproteobacteria bacterium]